mgnify:FL=1
MTRLDAIDKEQQADHASQERQYELLTAYTEGKHVGQELLELYRPENVPKLSQAPDYMRTVSELINRQPCDRTGTAALHGFMSAFVTEVLVLHQALHANGLAVETTAEGLH